MTEQRPVPDPAGHPQQPPLGPYAHQQPPAAYPPPGPYAQPSPYAQPAPHAPQQPAPAPAPYGQPGAYPPPGYGVPPGYPPPPPPGADIAQYAPPRPRRSVTLAVLVGVAFIGIALIAALQGGVLRPPGDTPPPPAGTAASPSTPGQPFTMPSDPRSTGTWEVVEREWSSTGVSVHVRIYANSGTISYAFSALGAGGTQTITPRNGPKTPALRTGVLEAGEQADGWVYLPLTRGDATLFLTTMAGRAYSAQPVLA